MLLVVFCTLLFVVVASFVSVVRSFVVVVCYCSLFVFVGCKVRLFLFVAFVG